MLDTVAASLRDVIGTAAAELADAGCQSPRLDAELLLCEALGSGWSRSRLVTSGATPVPPATLTRYEALVARRRAREPVAYILGRKDFRTISVAVDRRVLTPRPETELLVEVGLTLAPGARVADVGTGSGAVALALKRERPDLQMTGIDASDEALAVARLNAHRLDLAVAFVRADLLDGGTYDAVLANLPYVADGAAGELAPEIRSYEPREALFGGSDGLDVIRRLVDRLGGAADDLGGGADGPGGAAYEPGGAAHESVRLVGLEVGPGQAPSVITLLRRAGFRSIEVLPDLAGHERVVVGRR
jgi:release factor glutamine methyltransferase